MPLKDFKISAVEEAKGLSLGEKKIETAGAKSQSKAHGICSYGKACSGGGGMCSYGSACGGQ